MDLLLRARNSVSSNLRRKVTNLMKKVDAVSKLSGVSKRTLQYYDVEGILPAKRSEENYRMYDDAAMERLWEILWYKEMGFELNEIKIILAASKKESEKLFEQKIKIIGEQIQELENQKKMIRYIEKHGMIAPPANNTRATQSYTKQIQNIKKKNRWDKK